MASTLNRKSRDRPRASFNQPRRLSLFGQPTKQDEVEQRQGEEQPVGPPRGSSLAKSVSLKPLSKMQLSNSAWRPGLTLSTVRTLRGMPGSGGSVGLLRGREDGFAGERTFPPDPSSVVFPTSESAASQVDHDISDAASLSVHDGANASMSSSAITLSPSVSTSSFKRARRSLKMRVAVTLSGIFVPKPKTKRKGGALDGVDGVFCERELADRAARKGRSFLNGALSRGRKTLDEDSEAQEIRYSYISRSPSPPSPEIRPPSGLGRINPNADLSDVGGMGFREGNYSFTASATNLGLVGAQSPYDESKLSPTRAVFPPRPLASPDGTQSLSRTSQTPTPTPSHATSACSSPITNRPSIDSLSDIFYSPPPQAITLVKDGLPSRSASLPSPDAQKLDSPISSNLAPTSSMRGKPLPLIPATGTLDILFPPSPALSPPLSKSHAARVLGTKSPFTTECLQKITPFLPPSSLASLACVSRSFCRAVRPALYATITFDEVNPTSRKRCLLTLGSKREIAKFVESFSWNALVTLEDYTDEEEYSFSDEDEGCDVGESKPDLLARVISNLVCLRALTLVLSKNTHKLLHHVRSQLTSFSSTGLSSTACALFLSTWLPTQPSLTHLSLPDVFCFPLASAPTSPLSSSTSSSVSSLSKSSSSNALAPPIPRTVPFLTSFSGTTSLASILVPSRPVSCVELYVSQTLYDGLRPNEVMRCLIQSTAPLKELRVRVTGKVDARTLGKVISSAGAQLGSGIEILGVTGWEGETKELYAQVSPSLSLFKTLRTVDLSSKNNDTEAESGADQPNTIVSIADGADGATPTMLTKFSLISNALTPSANSSVSSLLSDSSSPRSSIASSLDLDLDDLNFDFPLPPTTATPPLCADADDIVSSCSRTMVRRISPYSVAHALADLDAELNSPAAAEERRKRAESEREEKEKERELENSFAAQWLPRCATLRCVKWASGRVWMGPTPSSTNVVEASAGETTAKKADIQ
ncbi:hypothetical protein SCHPADRAFT_1000104 [Schizopora paradoxa]|uniref:Uncharacterized protein n=1 Tax=Schizopora paradoxa TaxID=27342 RepID=A0A0H2RDQ6_9AGAM|nr:hypothetical protein SCHPADRAFT_1000104 [Schizopora paradoxa]